jgi:hypothetical protein
LLWESLASNRYETPDRHLHSRASHRSRGLGNLERSRADTACRLKFDGSLLVRSQRATRARRTGLSEREFRQLRRRPLPFLFWRFPCAEFLLGASSVPFVRSLSHRRVRVKDLNDHLRTPFDYCQISAGGRLRGASPPPSRCFTASRLKPKVFENLAWVMCK